MGEVYVCPTHEIECEGACPECMAEYPSLPAPETMTGDERAAEVKRRSFLTIPWNMNQDRVCALIGRSIFTHEWIELPRLMEEARNWQHPQFLDEIMGGLPDNKEVIHFDVDDDGCRDFSSN